MADWFDENNYDSQWRPPGGITGYDPNTGEMSGALGNDGVVGTNADPAPTQQPGGGGWPDNPVLNRIADAFRSRGITPTADLVMQWGRDIDANYEAKIMESIAGLTSQATPTAAATTTGGSSAATSGGAGDRDGFGAAWMGSGGRTVTDLKAFAEKWNAEHPNGKVTVGGSKGDKVYGPDGKFWADAVIAAGEGGGRGASWQTETGGSGGSGGSSSVTAGEFMTPWTEKFKAPTWEDLQKDQGFQSRLATALKGMESSAAQKGTLLTGGFQKALARENQNIASQEYDKLYGRAQGEYGQNYSIFENNQAKRFNRLSALAGTGQVAAGSLGAAGTNYANSQSGLYGERGNVGATSAVATAGNANNAISNLRDLYNNRLNA